MENKLFKILISFGKPQTGSSLLRLADQLTYGFEKKVAITALHVTPKVDISSNEASQYKKEAFRPLWNTAKLIGLNVFSTYKNSEDITREIYHTIEQGDYRLILFGASHGIMAKENTGKLLKTFLDQYKFNVGVLIDKGYSQPKDILWIAELDKYNYLKGFTDRLIKSNKATVSIIHSEKEASNEPSKEVISLSASYRALQLGHSAHKTNFFTQRFLDNYDLVILSYDTWKKVKNRLKDIELPNVLIINSN